VPNGNKRPDIPAGLNSLESSNFDAVELKGPVNHPAHLICLFRLVLFPSPLSPRKPFACSHPVRFNQSINQLDALLLYQVRSTRKVAERPPILSHIDRQINQSPNPAKPLRFRTLRHLLPLACRVVSWQPAASNLSFPHLRRIFAVIVHLTRACAAKEQRPLRSIIGSL
jgi:hypothetical protein